MQEPSDPIVFSRIEEATKRHRANRDRLLAVPEMVRLLQRYDAAIEATQEAMRRTDAARACSRCAQEIGSCCFQEVETWYDSMLLFINLLLGAELPQSRQFPNECLFLGTMGCRLRARYPFCLNYFCPTLKAQLGPSPMHSVLTAVGQELSAGWELERFLYRWFSEPECLVF